MNTIPSYCLLFFLINLSPVVFAQERPCLSYEPQVVMLDGIITRQTFPGQPGYESIKDGDEPERYWILHLNHSICVQADSMSDWNNETESNVKNLQLVFGERRYSDFPNMLKKKVRVTGTLYHQQTGHHHTKVLMTVQDITRLD
jgi:hypothetical protein